MIETIGIIGLVVLVVVISAASLLVNTGRPKLSGSAKAKHLEELEASAFAPLEREFYPDPRLWNVNSGWWQDWDKAQAEKRLKEIEAERFVESISKNPVLSINDRRGGGGYIASGGYIAPRYVHGTTGVYGGTETSQPSIRNLARESVTRLEKIAESLSALENRLPLETVLDSYRPVHSKTCTCDRCQLVAIRVRELRLKGEL